jgi:RNA recognition motif-containing protein
MSTKVFVGNLSFSTRENELAEEFEAAGKVVRANIITRGPRSLGYGFVEMADDAAAEAAVKVMDKKVIDGRQINVELAKPRDESAAAATTAARPARPRAPRGPRAPRNGGEGGVGGAPTGGAPAGGRRPRAPRPPRSSSSGPATDGTAATGEAGRRPRRPPAPRTTTPKTPSSTTLFVANLPFAVTDEGLADIFAEFKSHLKNAHVVRKINGRSKGFGFVEFDTAESQNAALKAIDKKTIEGRELSVKIALTPPAGAEGEKAGEKKAEASA